MSEIIDRIDEMIYVARCPHKTQIGFNEFDFWCEECNHWVNAVREIGDLTIKLLSDGLVVVQGGGYWDGDV